MIYKKTKILKSKSPVPGFAAGTSLILLLFAIGTGAFSSDQEQSELPIIDYKIGAKDLLEIKVFEQPELNQTVRVSEDGSITFSLLGKVEVAGLTAQELEQKLVALLEENLLQTAHVTVFIQEYQRVAVMGAVATPGMYEMAGRTTLLQILSQAGGLTPEAMYEAYVFRENGDGERAKLTIDLNELIHNGNQNLNIPLQTKDQVVIPVDTIINVYVYGEVKNPGIVQSKLSKKLTLLQAIAQAGGPTEWASITKIVIKRKDKDTGRELSINVNLKEITKGKIDDVELREGDVVIVP